VTSRQTPDRRRILSDPLILFKEIHPDAGRQQVARLTALWQRHLQLDSQLKATKENTRILSSRIGAAKRAGENLDGLRSEMQEASARLKEISAQLAETSNSILACFDTPGTQEHNDGEQLTPDTHPYPDKAAPGGRHQHRTAR